MNSVVMKRTLRILVVVIVAALVVVGAGSVYMLNYSLYPGLNKGRDIAASYDRLFHSYPYLEAWVDSLRDAGALQDLYLTDDGIILDGPSTQGGQQMPNATGSHTLHALYIPAAQPTGNTAIVIHGYTDCAVNMLMIGHIYSHALGYNVLLPDLHGHGLSYGDDIRMGWLDRLDVLSWADEISRLLGDDARMVVHGISMGAATTMMLAGEVEHGEVQHGEVERDADQPRPYLRCFVEDCGYTSVWDEFAYELRGIFHLPAFPLMYSTSLLCRLRLGWSFGEASALRQVEQCTRPMLFIHGDADTYVPTAMVYPLYEAKPEPKELWIVPGVAHAQAFKTFPEEYTQRVCDFVRRYLPDDCATLTGGQVEDTAPL